MMDNLIWQLLPIGAAACGGALALCTGAVGTEEPGTWEQINRYAQQATPMQQVTEVQQLREVNPGDWAYESLRSLVGRYGCLAGYPDGTFRGNRPLSRWEFAAGLNACLNTVERLLQDNVAVLREDLDKLRRLAGAFSAELAVLGTRASNLASRAAFIEDRQFSTTTKLKGEIAFTFSGAFGDEKAGEKGEDLDAQPTLDNRARLHFDTSFTGKDLLKVRLDALNTVPLGVSATGTNMTRLAFDGDTDNELVIGQLFYRFPLNQQLRVTIDGTGGRLFNNVPNYNPLFAHALTGSISRFGRFNPIYYQGLLGGGATVNYQFSDRANLSVGYLARNPAEPTPGSGLFNGSAAALAQLGINPTDTFNLGLTYVRAYYPSGQAFVSGATGSRAANTPFGSLPTSADQLGLETSWRVSPHFALTGWFGWTQAHAEASGRGFDGVVVDGGDRAEMLNWAVTLAFPDLGSEGSVAGLMVGNPPKVTARDAGFSDPDTAWHIQAQYLYQINDSIAINPAFFVIINPENDSKNPPIWVGAIRTIFEF